MQFYLLLTVYLPAHSSDELHIHPSDLQQGERKALSAAAAGAAAAAAAAAPAFLPK